MNKKTVFIISIIVNIILALVFVLTAAAAGDQLKFNYVEEDTITPDSLRMYLERENYGVAASLSHPVRGGADITVQDMDYYMLGEYADLLFLKEIFKESGNSSTAENCADRLNEIRSKMSDYGVVFDKMEQSAQNAIRK